MRRVNCPVCDHDSSCIFRCKECGHDLVGESATTNGSQRRQA